MSIMLVNEVYMDVNIALDLANRWEERLHAYPELFMQHFDLDCLN